MAAKERKKLKPRIGNLFVFPCALLRPNPTHMDHDPIADSLSPEILEKHHTYFPDTHD